MGMVTKWLQKGVMEMAEPLTKFDRSQVALSIEVTVPGTGLEPARESSHYTLNVARLPVPPSGRAQ